jgi:autotransporter-associated beta strand protein
LIHQKGIPLTRFFPKTSLLFLVFIFLFSSKVPAQAQTYDVSTTAGDNSAGSLGAAFTDISAVGPATSNSINFLTPPFNSNQTITLTSSYNAVVKNAGVGLTLSAPLSPLTINGSGFTVFNFSGGGTLNTSNLIIAGNIILGDNSTWSGSNTANGLNLSLGSNSTVSASQVLAGGGLDVTTSGSSSITGQITGTGALSVAGAGTLTLNNSSLNNNYSGGTNIGNGTNGTLSIGDASQLGTGTITLNNGTLQATSGVDLTQQVNLAAGGGTFNVAMGDIAMNGGFGSGSGTLTVSGGGTLSLVGSTLYTGNTVINAGSTLSLGSTANLTYTGTISGGGNLIILPSTTLTLTGNNSSYTGNTTINNATVQISNSNAFGESGSLTLDFGTLESTATVVLSNPTNLNFNSTIGGSHNITLGFVNLNTSTLTDTDTATVALSNVAGSFGSGNITEDAVGGTLILQGNYGGATTLTAGTMLAGFDGLGTSVLYLNGGTFGADGGSVFTNQVRLIANSSLGGLLSNSFSLTGQLTLGSGLTLTDMANTTVTLTNITGAGNLAENSPGGTLLLSGAQNSYTGTTNVTSGTLQVDNNTSLGTGSLVLNGGTLQSTANLTLANAVNLGASGGTVDVTAGNTTTLSGILSGAGGLTKNDSGTLVLSNILNSYNGGTNLNGGTLSVGSDADLGTTSGNLTFAGGTLLTTAGFSTNRTVSLGLGGGTFDVTTGNTTTLTGLVSGGGNLNLTDLGTLVLANSGNSYTGNTTVTGGATLSIGAAGDLGTSTLSLTNATLLGTGNMNLTSGVNFSQNSTLTAASGKSMTIAGGLFDSTVSGTDGLSISGPGTVVMNSSLNGNAATTLTTTINSGSTLALAGAGETDSSFTGPGNLLVEGFGISYMVNPAGSQSVTISTNTILSIGAVLQLNPNGAGSILFSGNTSGPVGLLDYIGSRSVTLTGTSYGSGIGSNGTGQLVLDPTTSMNVSGFISGSNLVIQADNGPVTLTRVIFTCRAEP